MQICPSIQFLRRWYIGRIRKSVLFMREGTLEARPVFHFTKHRIEAHICICFVVYKLYKELERILRLLNIGLSADKVPGIGKTISTGRRVEEQMLIYRSKEKKVITFFVSDDKKRLPIRLDM